MADAVTPPGDTLSEDTSNGSVPAVVMAAARARVGKAPTAFRTISEVASDLDLPQHVLRFWETKFPQIHPLKRGGGRRYYRPDDVALLTRIRALLYAEGYTIKGVQRLLQEGGGARVPAAAPAPGGDAPAPTAVSADPGASAATPTQPDPQATGLGADQRLSLLGILDDLRDMRTQVAALL